MPVISTTPVISIRAIFTENFHNFHSNEPGGIQLISPPSPHSKVSKIPRPHHCRSLYPFPSFCVLSSFFFFHPPLPPIKNHRLRYKKSKKHKKSSPTSLLVNRYCAPLWFDLPCIIDCFGTPVVTSSRKFEVFRFAFGTLKNPPAWSSVDKLGFIYLPNSPTTQDNIKVVKILWFAKFAVLPQSEKDWLLKRDKKFVLGRFEIRLLCILRLFQPKVFLKVFNFRVKNFDFLFNLGLAHKLPPFFVPA